MRRRGPSPDRQYRPFNLDRDPLLAKGDMARYQITIQQVADRAGVAYVTAANVLSGRRRSVYVERAVVELITEARERAAAEPTTEATT
jgi:hypothetical protein